MKKILVLFQLIGCVFLYNCSKDNMTNIGEQKQLIVSVKNTLINQSRAVITEEYLPDGAKVGMTMVDYNTLGVYEGVESNNVCITASGTGTDQVWSFSNPINLYMTEAAAVAYYPYSSTAADYRSIPISAGTTDYMYSEWIRSINAKNNKAAFTMKHIMSGIRINIRKNNYDGAGKINSMKIKVDGLGTSANLNASNGVVSSIVTTKDYITIPVSGNIGEDGWNVDWMGIPTGTGKSLEIVVNIDGTEYVNYITLPDNYESGKRVECNFIIGYNEFELQEVNIIEWEDIDAGENNLSKYSSYLTLEYNVTNTSTATQLFLYSTSIDSMWVDGTYTTTALNHKFTTTGYHEVKVKIKGTSLCDNMFWSNKNLRRVKEFPATLQSIGRAAFGQNSELISIAELPENLKYIYASAFFNCTKLVANLKIPASCTNIDGTAFNGCAKIESVIVDDNNATYDSRNNCNALMNTATNTLILGCKNTIIPEGCQTIANGAFAGCTGLKRMVIPNTVKTIASSAFEGCTGLTGTLTIPNSVTSMESFAFAGCTRLKEVKLSENLLVLKEGVFMNCTGLTGTLTIPNYTKFIEDGTHNNSKNTYTGTFTGCTGITALNLGTGIVEIGANAFHGCTGLISVTIPESCKYIGMSAFYNCTGIKSLDLGTGIIGIGSSAFQGCTGLKETLIIPNSVTEIGESSFSGTGITGVKLSDNLKHIGNSSFQNTKLTTLVIPNTIKSIGSSAFYGCNELKSVDLGTGVQTIGNLAFFTCTNLTGVLTVPNSVTHIYERAFLGCSNINTLNLGDNLQYIGPNVFTRCTGLTGTLTIPNSVTEIGNDAFNGCTGINKILLSNNLNDLKDNVFLNCSGVTGTVNVPNSVKSIGNSCFEGCSNISNFEFGTNIKSIGNKTFCNCTSLTGTLTIPNSVTEIGNAAFKGCTGLKALDMGEGVETLGTEIWYGCKGLQSIIISPKIKSLPDAKVENSNYFGIFEGCSSLKTIDFKNLEYIGTYAFKGCGIEELILSDNINTIGKHAFYGNKQLNNIHFSKSMTNIAEGTFYGCVGLTGTLTIPGNIKDIGKYAFRDCSALTALEIQEGVQSMGEEAFYNCTGLTLMTVPSTFNVDSSLNNFSWCNKLGYITIYVTEPPGDSFYPSMENGTLFVPYGCKNAYKNWIDSSRNWVIVEMEEIN